MIPSYAWLVIPVAFMLDLLAGDPERFPHPIRWMGNAIERLEPPFRRRRMPLSLSGLAFALSLIAVTWSFTALILKAADFIHPAMGMLMETILIFYTISVSSLEKAAMEVWVHVIRRDLPAAKRSVAMIVGREVERLSEQGVIRAAVESVAENFVDGFVSPLFYAAVGGAPLAMAYKMINTLDSMVGYRNERYEKFGKAAARIDDAANFIPARLAVPVMALAAGILSNRSRAVMATVGAEATHHSSPNAGYPEAAMAGALRVRLNGPCTYHGKQVNKPYIGKRFPEVRPVHIKRACDLMLLSAVIWALTAWGIAGLRAWLTG